MITKTQLHKSITQFTTYLHNEQGPELGSQRFQKTQGWVRYTSYMKQDKQHTIKYEASWSSSIAPFRIYIRAQLCPGRNAVSRRWTGWVWEIASWSWRLQKFTNHLRGIYGIHLKWIKQNRKISTCNRVDLESLGSWPTLCPKTSRANCRLDRGIISVYITNVVIRPTGRELGDKVIRSQGVRLQNMWMLHEILYFCLESQRWTFFFKQV